MEYLVYIINMDDNKLLKKVNLLQHFELLKKYKNKYIKKYGYLTRLTEDMIKNEILYNKFPHQIISIFKLFEIKKDEINLYFVGKLYYILELLDDFKVDYISFNEITYRHKTNIGISQPPYILYLNELIAYIRNNNITTKYYDKYHYQKENNKIVKYDLQAMFNDNNIKKGNLLYTRNDSSINNSFIKNNYGLLKLGTMTDFKLGIDLLMKNDDYNKKYQHMNLLSKNKLSKLKKETLFFKKNKNFKLLNYKYNSNFQKRNFEYNNNENNNIFYKTFNTTKSVKRKINIHNDNPKNSLNVDTINYDNVNTTRNKAFPNKTNNKTNNNIYNSDANILSKSIYNKTFNIETNNNPITKSNLFLRSFYNTNTVKDKEGNNFNNTQSTFYNSKFNKTDNFKFKINKKDEIKSVNKFLISKSKNVSYDNLSKGLGKVFIGDFNPKIIFPQKNAMLLSLK